MSEPLLRITKFGAQNLYRDVFCLSIYPSFLEHHQLALPRLGFNGFISCFGDRPVLLFSGTWCFCCTVCAVGQTSLLWLYTPPAACVVSLLPQRYRLCCFTYTRLVLFWYTVILPCCYPLPVCASYLVCVCAYFSILPRNRFCFFAPRQVLLVQ